MTTPVRVLAICDYFPPARRGGAGRGLSDAIEASRDHCAFRVLTRDRDALSGELHRGVTADRWQQRGNATVKYASPRALRMLSMVEEIRSGTDAVYLNSLFSTLSQRVLWARRAGLFRIPVLLAPEGELSAGALSLKANKKRLYLALAKGVGLYRGVHWKATSSVDVANIKRRFPDALVELAGYGYRAALPASGLTHPPKRRGHLRLLYLSRIERNKNLAHLLEELQHVEGEVELSIVGPVEDRRYWRKCQRLLEGLPARVKATYLGERDPQEVWEHYAAAHVFVLPTLGENFGYVIADALAAGRPVVISDTTPWGEVSHHGGGFVVPLEDREGWRRALQACVDLDEAEYSRMGDSARSSLLSMESLPTLGDAILATIGAR